MTIISDDPSWWPLIESNDIFTYFAFACLAIVTYDWVLTFGQEVELVWRQRCSLMTVLYLAVRYIGLLYPLLIVICAILGKTQGWTTLAVNAMVGVIMIKRLHAMYQQSRKMLIFLVVIFLAVTINSVVITAIGSSYISAEELILSGTHQCILLGDKQILVAETWIFGSVWEVLSLFLCIWIAVKHFHELRQSLGEWDIKDCFTVLMKTHVLYFAGFATASCFNFGMLSPTFGDSLSVETLYSGSVQIVQVVQLFVLGPRLILSIRKYNAQLVANSDEGTAMTTIAFQESTGGDV